MPKEQSSRQFRKGTKSCIECRQRKLRCILPDHGNPPCQNCTSRGRECVLQVDVGRSSEVTGGSSKDRINQLENSLSSLWSVVRDLKTELGHSHDENLQGDLPNSGDTNLADTDSEVSDVSPMAAPTHLQQLFNNEFLGTSKDNDYMSHMSPNSGSEKTHSGLTSRARARLQSLMPPKEDVRAISTLSLAWMSLYNSLFPTASMFTSADEMVSSYDALQLPTANPASVAMLLLSVAITVVQKPPESTVSQLTGIKDTSLYVNHVSRVIEEIIINNDTLAGSIEGIEASLLYIRLQFVRYEVKKIWLMLRRVVALAELIGLPKAAQRAGITEETRLAFSSDWVRSASKLEAAAALWQSICSIDRMVATMFNLPIGTAAYGSTALRQVVLNGKVNPQAFLCQMADIGTKVQEIDDAYVSKAPDSEVFEKVFKAEQFLKSLAAMTPQSWWRLGPNSEATDHILQYWYTYSTIRTHLQLALRNGTDSTHVYSYVACTQACTDLAQRYIGLRGLLPSAFFAGRVLDLQVMTAAVFLLFTSHQATSSNTLSNQGSTSPSPTELVERILELMDSVADKVGGDFGGQAAKAIRALNDLLNRPTQVDSQNLTLKIPLLGKISVNRSTAGEDTKTRNISRNGTPANGYQQVPQSGTSNQMDPNFMMMPSVDPSDFSWYMDFQNNFPISTDSAFEIDQWLSSADLNMTGQI